MSRFKRIKNKTTKKSSVSIDEKISALNQELEKTGMLSEKMTTGNVLSTSEYVPPQEYKEGEVPNHSGVGGEGFSQNSAGSGVAGDPPNHSDMSDLYNSDVGHPIYKSTSYNGVSSFGIVIGPSFGAGNTYGIIENGNIYRAVLGGFISGGTRGPGNYESIYRSYLQTNEQSPGFYSQEQIDLALENWQLAIQVHAILVEIGFDNAKFTVPWKAWRRAILFEDLSGTPTYNHPTKGTIHLVTFNLLGMPNTYAEQDARPPGTTNPQRRGLEDDPIFPGPIANLFGLGQRAFDWLRGKAEAAKKAFDDVKDTFGYKTEIGRSILSGEEVVRTSDEVTDREKEELKDDLNGIEDNIPINKKKEPYSDDNFYEDENGNIVKKPTPGPNPINKVSKEEIDNMSQEEIDKLSDEIEEWGKRNEKYNEVNAEHPDTTDFVSKKQKEKSDTDIKMGEVSGLAGRGKAHHQFVNPTDNVEDAYYNYKDYAYANVESTDTVELPGSGDEFVLSALELVKSGPKGRSGNNETRPNPKIQDKYGENIRGMSVVEVKIPYSEWSDGMKKSFHKRTGTKPPTTNESYITEGVGLGLYEPEAMNVNLADIRKGVMPEYPKKPPAEMIDGYHEKSRIRPKKAKNEEPYLKIDRKDLIRSHRLKKSEADEMMNTINMINDYIRDNPADLIHAQMRYPVDDPRLAELNWKMDQMLEAGEKYMDSNFKENKKLYKRAMDRTKNNIKLTDPEYVQQKYDELRGTHKPKKTKLVGRLSKHLNKYESKSLFKHVNSKDFRKINERKNKIEEHKKQVQKEMKIEYEQIKNDWRKDLGNNTY